MSKTAISPHAVGVLNITNSLTFNKCTVESGGVYIIGRTCTINLRLRLTEAFTSGQEVIQGLPKPLNSYENYNCVATKPISQVTNLFALFRFDGVMQMSSSSDLLASGAGMLVTTSYVIDGNEIMTEYVTGDEDIVENAITFSSSAEDANSDSIVTKSGKMVTVQLFCKATAAIGSGTAIATLAQGVCPKKVVNTPGMVLDNTNHTVPAECVRIGTDGVVTLRTKSLNANDGLGFIVTYRKS